MGRHSKLTGEQWAQVERRLSEGESYRGLARAFGVSEATIRERFPKARQDQVIAVAKQIVETERALQALPIPAQISAHSHAARLRAMSDDMLGAGQYGAATSHRLNALAHKMVAKVNEKDPMKSADDLKGVAVLTKLANDAATIPLGLLAANKESVKRLNETPPPPEERQDLGELTDAELAELEKLVGKTRLGAGGAPA